MTNLFNCGDINNWVRFTICCLIEFTSYTLSSFNSSVECNHSENLDELFLNLKDNIKKNDIILFKASRAIQLDKVIKKFL